MITPPRAFAEPMISNLYYCEFAGNTFVVQAEAEAVEKTETTLAILQGIKDLLGHGIRIVLVLGKGTEFERELRASFGARPHPETNRLIIPETALARIQQERRRIGNVVEGLCRLCDVPCRVFPESVIRAERRIAHGSTGMVTEIKSGGIQAALDQRRLPVIGFGGEDDDGRFLHVSATSLAADLAVELGAQKLLFLMKADGVFLPDHRGDRRRLSFADLEQLLCLLQRKDPSGNFVLSGTVLPKVHASIRAVAGHVGQVHLVSYSRLLEEILTRTGVGTMIERRQSHHVDYARQSDLEEVYRLHAESQGYTTPHGTPYVKPLDRSELERRLPQTLVLKHRGIIVGKLHATDVPGAPGILQIGGLVIGENHQDSQQGQLLLGESLGRFREKGYAGAVAITAAKRAKRLFERAGGQRNPSRPWQTSLLKSALERYALEERRQVQLFEFSLAGGCAHV